MQSFLFGIELRDELLKGSSGIFVFHKILPYQKSLEAMFFEQPDIGRIADTAFGNLYFVRWNTLRHFQTSVYIYFKSFQVPVIDADQFCCVAHMIQFFFCTNLRTLRNSFSKNCCSSKPKFKRRNPISVHR